MKELVVLLGFLISLSTAMGADTSKGADNLYASEKVAVQKASFQNQYRMNFVGNLFLPRELNRSAMNPALVVGHPMGAVKEQSANLYATKMAERGFVTLSLDLSFWGESDGQPRNAVSPDFAQTLEQRKQIIAAAAEQRYAEFAGGETRYTSGTVHELKEDTHPIQHEFFDLRRTDLRANRKS